MSGKGYLTGAGPGDPDLLTRKAWRLLQDCDVVVYDRLAGTAILDQIPAGVTRVYVGKRDGEHAMSQADINELLVRLGRSGYRVVRLKGGDPLIFGRGGEEALALAAAGIPFEIVPGITAASACSACAGIPLTHRGLSRGVEFLTGRDWRNRLPGIGLDRIRAGDRTLVVYMGLGTIGELARALIEAGLPGATPAAAIAHGASPEQRTCLAPLGSIARATAEAGLDSPVLFIIGEVVRLAPALDWFGPAAAAAAPACAGGRG